MPACCKRHRGSNAADSPADDTDVYLFFHRAYMDGLAEFISEDLSLWMGY
jgi:hypothetical protein